MSVDRIQSFAARIDKLISLVTGFTQEDQKMWHAIGPVDTILEFHERGNGWRVMVVELASGDHIPLPVDTIVHQYDMHGNLLERKRLKDNPKCVTRLI